MASSWTFSNDFESIKQTKAEQGRVYATEFPQSFAIHASYTLYSKKISLFPINFHLPPTPHFHNKPDNGQQGYQLWGQTSMESGSFRPNCTSDGKVLNAMEDGVTTFLAVLEKEIWTYLRLEAEDVVVGSGQQGMVHGRDVVYECHELFVHKSVDSGIDSFPWWIDSRILVCVNNTMLKVLRMNTRSFNGKPEE